MSKQSRKQGVTDIVELVIVKIGIVKSTDNTIQVLQGVSIS